jgi:ABC-2 type transport system permease protein
MTSAGVAGPPPAVPGMAIERPSLPKRLLGLGSVFGKSVRDSRRLTLGLGVFYALIVVLIVSQVAAQFDTALKRQIMAQQLAALPPVFQGMLGAPVGIDRLGGFVSWRALNFIPVIYGIWAIVALAGTLAGELARGSLDVVASTPLVRRRLAVEKVLAYLASLAVTVAMIGLVTFVGINAFATLPGDSIDAGSVAAHMVWLFLMILAPGAAAFAAAPFVGRGGGLGVGAIVLFGSFIVSSYADIVPAFDAVRNLSYFHLTAGFRPLAGTWDWASIVILAVACGLLLVAGVESFTRRDMLVPTGGRVPVPRIRLWVAGPFSRGLGERLPAALVWGAFLGLFGLILSTSADAFVASLSKIPQIAQMITQLFPNADILSVGGFLQLAFFEDGIIIIGLAAAFFVGGWASDEGEGRLEVVLAAPLGRLAWGLKSAASVLAALAVTTAVLVLAVVAGTLAQGEDPARTAVGVSIVGLYGMALAGIGLAIGGLVRPSLAGPLTLVVGLGFFLLDLIGTILEWPTWLLDLALNRHLGRPMIGDVDEFGVALCVAIAIGGVVLSAVGLRRRDIGR